MASDGVPDSFLILSGMEITYADSVFCTLLGVESQKKTCRPIADGLREAGVSRRAT